MTEVRTAFTAKLTAIDGNGCRKQLYSWLLECLVHSSLSLAGRFLDISHDLRHPIMHYYVFTTNLIKSFQPYMTAMLYITNHDGTLPYEIA